MYKKVASRKERDNYFNGHPLRNLVETNRSDYG